MSDLDLAAAAAEITQAADAAASEPTITIVLPGVSGTKKPKKLSSNVVPMVKKLTAPIYPGNLPGFDKLTAREQKTKLADFNRLSRAYNKSVDEAAKAEAPARGPREGGISALTRLILANPELVASDDKMMALVRKNKIVSSKAPYEPMSDKSLGIVENDFARYFPILLDIGTPAQIVATMKSIVTALNSKPRRK